MVYNKRLKKAISIICFLLSLSFSVLMFSGCSADPKDKVLATVWNRESIVVNGNEYVLVVNDNWVQIKGDHGVSNSMINNGTWSWQYSRDKMNEIGKIRVSANWTLLAKQRLYASNEDPPIYLYIAADMRDVCYMLKSHTLPSKYTSSFISIDFHSNAEDLYFESAVSMEDMISYENAISDKDCEKEYLCTADFYYSENDIIYLSVHIYRINEGFYIRLDDVFYPIVMPEILDSLNTKK